jgi:hypothetical protein
MEGAQAARAATAGGSGNDPSVSVPPRRRRRALDAAVVVSTIGCIVLATFVALSVSGLSSLSDSVVAAGRALDQTARAYGA